MESAPAVDLRGEPAALPTPEDHVIVLFGATGDLAKRKLLPGIFHLNQAGLMPERFCIVGTARNAIHDHEFRAIAKSAVDEFGREPTSKDSWDPFAERLSFVGTGEGLDALGHTLAAARTEIGGDPRLL